MNWHHEDKKQYEAQIAMPPLLIIAIIIKLLLPS
jgi:hypothetical protein